ncbi:cytochrome o ubiquinol oxidase subunit IV [Paraburkholderia caballeronis]|uniref:cytochrome o ubiquinol oxidase subunit IV n=1 Tax=Paraburkholderia caballeronis TaxID=416943 RepID=UPI0010666E0D|nr:cytochrome o ubiquinol oxidase subunit IV [Paraburkholderia caballeronis]TDV15048.1 cytochrome bo3 quinol oxidase subunit 4 [Paraburkholderia caballeronis]TDV16827.1 cytochrome bo3 quinol oxidase subunit 4 [Paraburkholderia caballeronis]TDV25784.1 cytochrome bo3 quinol oxidase subunit 4 [Paraburkholderia caballeronis]
MAHSHSPAQEPHGSLGGYIAGFVLSVLLTAGAFGLVPHGAMDPGTSMIVIAILALVQIIVHMVFFLHLNTSSGQGWNLLAIAYTVLAAAFLVFGTIWVMHNVTMNMMSR